MARLRFETDDSFANGGTTSVDPTRLGGYGARTADGGPLAYDQNGNLTNNALDANGNPIIVSTGVDDIVNRSRGLADAAAQRQAYQLNTAGVNAAQANGMLSRDQQESANRLLASAARGSAPSRAEIVGNQAAGQGLSAQLAASAGARPSGMAAASMAAQQAGGMNALQNVGQFSAMRSGELNGALGAYGQGATSMRAGDFSQQGLAQRMAEAQAQSENSQRDLNDTDQAFYEQQAWKARKEAADRAARVNGRYADMYAGDSARSQGLKDSMWAGIANGASTVGTIAASGTGGGGDGYVYGASGKAPSSGPGSQDYTNRMSDVDGSDERMKDQVVPLDNPGPGMERHWDRDVSSAPGQPGGASLSGPTPRYGMAKAAAARPAASATKERKMTDAELEKYARELQGNVHAQKDAQLAAGPSVKDPMGHALATGLQPFQYEYKPGFREDERQVEGEKNVGPMAQDMASNPITASAVKQDPQGLLYIDQPKALKLSLGGIGYLAAKQREQEAEIARLKGRA